MILVIDRRKWYRGRSGSRLLITDHRDKTAIGQMCCLGFHGRKIGISDYYLAPAFAPADVADALHEDRKRIPRDLKPLLDGLNGSCNNEVCCDLMKVNDKRGIKESTRELKVRELFGKIGVQVRFTN